MDKGIDKIKRSRDKSEEAQRKSEELTREAEKAKENLTKLKSEVEQADLRVSQKSEAEKNAMEAEATAKKEAAKVRESLNLATRQSEETIKLSNKAKAEAEQTSKRYETLKLKAEKKSRDERLIKSMEQSRRDYKETQKKSAELTQEVEKARENLTKIKAEVEQVDLRVSEAAEAAKNSMESEAAIKKEAAQARDRLKTAIKRSEDTIKLANSTKTELEQAVKKLDTLKERVEKNPGDEKSVQALERAKLDFEEVRKKNEEVTREVEKARENVAWVKGEVEHADMRVTKAASDVKTFTEAEVSAKKEAVQTRDRFTAATGQSEETIKLADKVKKELEQANRRLEAFEEKAEKKSRDEKSVQILEHARFDFEEAKKKSVELSREVETKNANMSRKKEEVERADLRVREATAVVKTSTEAKVSAIKEAELARDRLTIATRQSEKTIKLANTAKNEVEQAIKKYETTRIQEDKKDKKVTKDMGKEQILLTTNTEEDRVTSNELYQGKIKIHVDRPVTRNSIRELERSLIQGTGVSIISTGGSIDEGACIFIHMDQPSSLETLLSELSIIESFSIDKRNLHLTLKTT